MMPLLFITSVFASTSADRDALALHPDAANSKIWMLSPCSLGGSKSFSTHGLVEACVCGKKDLRAFGSRPLRLDFNVI